MPNTQWSSRIVGEGEEAPDQLLANPRNWRRHPGKQQSALSGVLGELGWIQRVIVNRRTGYLVDGHARVGVAMQAGQKTIPVLYVDLTEAEEALALATLDPISAMATADAATLKDLLAEVSTGEAAVMEMLAELAEAAGIFDQAGTDGLTDADEIPEPPADPITRPGDLWILGNHRLVCGDSTNARDIARAMGGALADLVWTDPPYGVAIGDKNKLLDELGHGSNRVKRNLINDTLDEAGLERMLDGAFDNAVAHCNAGASWYVAAPAGPLHIVFGQALKDRGIWRQTIQWVKNNATFSPMGVSYHWASEPIFYGWLPNGAHRYFGDRKQTTVWEIDRPSRSAEHPTMKPVELVARAIQHATLPGEVVLDLFLGSGTTLIAAEQEGRHCRGVEIDPIYCDVIVERWEAFTGREAIREAATSEIAS